MFLFSFLRGKRCTVLAVFFMVFLLFGEIFFVSAYYSYDFSYDNSGNLIKDPRYIYEYDSFNQLSKIKDAGSGKVISEYLYDDEETRIAKTTYSSSGAKTITYYAGKDFVQVSNSTGKYNSTYYYDEQALVASKDSNGNIYYNHPNQLGSTELVTNQVGGVVEETYYEPFGNIISGGKSSRFLFTGKEKDSDSGLNYYGARYYDSMLLHKFTQADTVIQDVYNPQSLNRYSYALNNPLKYTDPSGHFFFIPIILGALVVADLISTAYDIYKYNKNPTPENFNYVTLDLVTAGAFGLGIKGAKGAIKAVDIFRDVEKGAEVAKGAGKAGKILSEGSKIKDTENVIKVSVDTLYGHATNDPVNLFRAGAETHKTNPIDVIKIGKDYMINDGVGRTMRAIKAGESSVNAKIIREYEDLEHLKTLATFGDKTAKGDLQFFEKSLKVDDPARWSKLQK